MRGADGDRAHRRSGRAFDALRQSQQQEFVHPVARKPAWIRVKAPTSPVYGETRGIVREHDVRSAIMTPLAEASREGRGISGLGENRRIGCDGQACRRCSPMEGQSCLNETCVTGRYDCNGVCYPEAWIDNDTCDDGSTESCGSSCT